MGKQKVNEYQRLVAIIHRLFDSVEARITLGADIVVRSEEGSRDVDILVEYGSVLLPTRVAIEAKDWKKAVGIETVEAYRTKYHPETGIKVDKVIIVGNKFSAPARSLARRLGFDLHTLTTLESVSPSDFSREPDSDLKMWLGPMKKELMLYLRRTSGGWLKGGFAYGVLISKRSGRNFGSPVSLAERIMKTHLGADVSQYYMDHEGKRLHLTAELSLPYMIYRRTGYRDEPVKTLYFDFGTHLLFPDFPIRQNVTYETQDGISKKLTRVKPVNQNINISITYEDPLKSIYLDGVEDHVEIVTFNLDFEAELARIGKEVS